MKQIEFSRPPPAVMTMLRAAASGFRRARVVEDLTAVSRVLPEVRVEAEPVDAYRRLCGFAPDGALPLTYPQILGFSLVLDYLASDDFPFPVLGLIHLANRIEQFEPIAVGDTLRIEVSSGGLFAHRKGQAFTVNMRASRAGADVWKATQTLLRRGVSSPVGPVLESGTPAGGGASRDELAVGRRGAIEARAEIGRRYARLSGDFNPIHLWPMTAWLFGFRRAIAHGLWSQARAVAYLNPQLASRHTVLDTDFMAPLMLPSQPTIWAGQDRDRLRFELRDAEGERIHFRSEWSGVE